MFINNLRIRNEKKIIVECCGGGGGNNLRKIIHITEPTYTINILPIELMAYSSILYIADVETSINLPSLDDTILNVQLEIINNSGSNITLNAVEDDLLFNNLYISKTGSPTFMLTTNKYCKLISRKQINLFSWILLTS
jgi:hypothetical protein